MTIPRPAGRGSVSEVFSAFMVLGLTSFGGPIAHLGYFRDEIVGKRRWVSDEQYAEIVGLSQFLPGPASSQVGVALGLVRAGYRGAVAAWLAFTLPSALLLVGFGLGAVALDGAVGRGLTSGLKAVAVAVVAHAVWGMARTLTPDVRRILIALAAAAAALLAPGSLGQIVAILGGLVAGVAVCRTVTRGPAPVLSIGVSRSVGATALAVYFALLVFLPIVARTTDHMPSMRWIGITDAFYRAGALVFGGGHVVLPLLQAEPVIATEVSAEQFMAGYGAAQAVPGPLFTFAAYLGMHLEPGAMGLASAALALIAVFLPGILLLIGVLPFWSELRSNDRVRAAIAGANAAVVGILAAALYTPVITSGITGAIPLMIAVAGFGLLALRKVPAWAVVVLGASAGVASAVISPLVSAG